MGWALVTQQGHWPHLCAPGGLPGAPHGHTLQLLWPQILQKYVTPRWGSSPSNGLGVLIRAKRWGRGEYVSNNGLCEEFLTAQEMLLPCTVVRV